MLNVFHKKNYTFLNTYYYIILKYNIVQVLQFSECFLNKYEKKSIPYNNIQ